MQASRISSRTGQWPTMTAVGCKHVRMQISCAAGKGFGAKTTPTTPAQTCPCGSRVVYRECCEPYHKGAKQPETPEGQLRARFSAFVKNEQEYVVKTFHPSYLPFKYPDFEGDAAEQLKLDVKMACNSYDYSSLKILRQEPGASPDEHFLEFQYKSVQKASERRTNSRHTRVKAAPIDRNLDGSVKVSETVERSRFVRDDAHGWRFADYELKSYPEWMAEAKEAEMKSRQQLQQQMQEPQPNQAVPQS